jgi:hypothetical protein
MADQVSGELGLVILLNGWQDYNDLQIVGDFMGLGYEPIMFINSINTNDDL